ncbi:MAG: CoA pyrophosphatase [Chloroflexi bacterium]|jgi:8-oxo-dGTP pyrophosphatase MutT (NUDIX family)|nr:CoA pyrophosphatase [Chloroflexota bacterium]MBT7080309.1 CoA pyrophosphatase [Chloroflexota bacterium]MBT7289996.1 CoA pyrophosphatase [Chloroflexota bacterium]
MKQKITDILANYKKQFIKDARLKSAGVLIPMFEKDDVCHILFTKRTDKVQYHKGEISFPGGGLEDQDGGDIRRTTLREVCEEIGVAAKDIEILGELDDLITTSNYIVTPLVGEIPYPYNFKLSSFEVENVIEVPVKALLKDHSDTEGKIDFNGELMDSYIYEYNGNTIWGATARILHHFLNLIFGEIEKESDA